MRLEEMFEDCRPISDCFLWIGTLKNVSKLSVQKVKTFNQQSD